ncbi:MAG TPA: FAD-binding oxidoreductase [Chloroflexota bacterium]|nr:FAD-binding oxidoreductase [Chloroflexota bacterium]
MTIGETVVSSGALAALRAGVRGQVLFPGEDGYDAARTVWNGMIDRRPALIIRAAGVADVIAAVNFARETSLVFSVRGGGHNATGSAVADGGLMLDMSLMKGIRVDPEGRTVRAEAGCLWGDLDHETQAFGLAVTGGQVSDTGIGGLTLGGGVGHLMRLLGATVDNLLSVDLVTAGGRLLTVDSEHHPDLFWAVRGGGGNFGVVTSFEYRLHPVGPIILGGMLLYPAEQAAEILRFYREWMADAPDELCVTVALMTAPPAPFVPESLRLQPAVGVIVCYVGDIETGQQLIAPLRAALPPAADLTGPMPYTVLQSLIDDAAPWHQQVFLKAANLTGLSDDVIDTIVQYGTHLTSPLSIVPLNPWGGAISRVPEDATALGHRDTAFSVYIFAVWPDPADSERHMAWARSFHEALRPHMNGTYVNELGQEGRVAEAYPPATYARLVEVKNRYDPTNFFHMNQNIKPTV